MDLIYLKSVQENLQLSNENLYLVSQGGKFLDKKRFQSFGACPHIMTLKSSPISYALPSPINITTIIGQHKKSPPSPVLVSSSKPVHQANFTTQRLTLDH